MEESVKVGHLIKSFGKDGLLRVSLESPFRDDVRRSEYLLVDLQGELIPYFIDFLDISQDLIGFESIKSPEDANIVSDVDVYLLKRDVKAKSTVPLDSDQFNGYKVIDQHDLEIGVVSEVLEMPMQILLRIVVGEGEYLVPLHEELLLGMDQKAKILQIEIADGLMDL